MHGSGAKSEANCPHYALGWYAKVLAAAGRVTHGGWARQVAAYAQRGEAALLFDDPSPAPNTPTAGRRIARALRSFLPEGYEEPLSGLLDQFLRDVTREAPGPAAPGRVEARRPA